MKITIYTDGSCAGNPGPGAYAAIVFRDGKKETLTGFEAYTTNNRMELRAAIKGLEPTHPGDEVRVVTDCQYLTKGMNEYRNNAANPDLWDQLEELASERTVEWTWCRAKAGDPLQREAHRRAVRELHRGMERLRAEQPRAAL